MLTTKVNMRTLRAFTAAALVVATFGSAMAKLPPAPPAPPLTDVQKAEAKAKADAAADLAKQQQARAEDRVAARYFADLKAQGKPVPTPQLASVPAPPATVGMPAPVIPGGPKLPATK